LANTSSAQKADRQRIKRTRINHARKSAMRTAIKKVRKAIEAKDSEGAKEALGVAVPLIDRAGGRGVIKRNTASRLVSRLTQAVEKV